MKQNMFAGIDIGSLSCEAVILYDNKIISSVILSSGSFPRKAGQTALSEAIKSANISFADLKGIVCTGYGRNLLPDTKAVTEITCFARGANFLMPQVEMVIDIGGQDSKVILVDKNGHASDFITNDKCAAGTGRFLETMARALDMQIDNMALLGHDSEPASISNTCGVFAESEVVGLLAIETPIESIIAGINKSVADRTLGLIHKLGIREKVMFCGGVSKNIGIRKVLEKSLGKQFFIPDEPQIVGALGAAIIASQSF